MNHEREGSGVYFVGVVYTSRDRYINGAAGEFIVLGAVWWPSTPTKTLPGTKYFVVFLRSFWLLENGFFSFCFLPFFG